MYNAVNVAIATATYCSLNNRRRYFIMTSSDIKGMKALEKCAVFFGRSYNIQRARICIDDWSTGDANFWHDIIATDVAARDGRNTVCRIDKTLMPECQRRALLIGVKCIDAIVLRCHEDDIMRPSVDV